MIITYLLVFLSIELKFNMCHVGNNENWNKYLPQKRDYVERELNRRQIKREILPYEERRKHIDETYNFSRVFEIHNTTFLLLDSNIYRILIEEKSLGIKYVQNISIHIDTNSLLKTQGGFLLIAYNSEAKIYGFSNTTKQFNYVQSIEQADISDAKFFTNRNQQYLTMASTSNGTLTPLCIYKWMASYFDLVDEVLSFRADSKITSFSSDQSEIIVLAENSAVAPQVKTSVYEFQNDVLTKLQQLRFNSRPQYVLTYELDKKRYVLICNSSFFCTLYWWSGSELADWSIIDESLKIDNALLMYYNATPIIVVTQNDKLLAYKPTSNSINLIGKAQYQANIDTISSINYAKYNENTIFTVAAAKSGGTEIKSIALKLNQDKIGTTPSGRDVLLQCLTNLKEKLHHKQKVQERFQIPKKVKPGSQDPILTQSKASTAPAYSASVISVNKNRGGDDEADNFQFSKMEDKVNTLREGIERLKPILRNFVDTTSDLVINGKTTVQGLIKGKTLIAQNIQLKQINNEKWAPEQWLSISKPQTIAGFFQARTITAEDVFTTPEVAQFDGVILTNKTNVITSPLIVKNLKILNLHATRINNISLADVYMKNNPTVITGAKQFKRMTVDSIQTTKFNEQNPEEALDIFTKTKPGNVEFSSNLFVDNLEIEQIDGVHWNTFRDSIYRTGVTKSIAGSLRLPQLKVKKLRVKSINDIPVEFLMTTSTDQVIQANIDFQHILAGNVTANTINGIPFDQLATFGDTNITGFVKMDNLLVLENLNVDIPEDKLAFQTSNDHIMGTREEDLLQIYHDKIKIHGNLIMNNLRVPNPGGIIYSEKEFSPDIHKLFWMKSVDQSIPAHVELKNGMGTSHLLTNLLNNKEMRHFMLQNSNQTLETSFYFENFTILGSMFLNEKQNHSPNLRQIDENAVKNKGSFAISGSKIFKNTLKVGRMFAERIGDTEVSSILNRRNFKSMTGRKYFKNLIVKGDLAASNISADFINGVNLRKLQEDALYIDESRRVPRLHFSNLTVDQLNISRVNGKFLGDYFNMMEEIYSKGVINNLEVDGDVSINNMTNLMKINGKDADVLLHNTLKYDQEGRVTDYVKFFGHVKVKNFVINKVNGIDLRILTERLLYKNHNQIITAIYTFDNLELRDLKVAQINNVNVSELIDVKDATVLQNLTLPLGLHIMGANIESLFAEGLPCSLGNVLQNMKSPPTQEWENIHVTGNVTLWDEDCDLKKIFEKAVTREGDHVITGPVHFFSTIVVDNVIIKESINSVNIGRVLDDALLKNCEQPQVVSGFKIFSKVKAFNASVLNNTEVGFINQIDIPELKKNIVYYGDSHTKVIQGRKTFFGGLQTNKVVAKMVSNLLPENIVSMENLQRIPKAAFQNLEIVENLYLNFINSFDFNSFLIKRVLCYSPTAQILEGSYVFDDLTVDGNVLTTSINGINISDIVFDEGIQNIKGQKRFSNIDAVGNVKIDYINGLPIPETYEKAILNNEDSIFTGNMEITQPAEVYGNLTAKYINNYPVEKLLYLISNDVVEIETSKIQMMMYNIETAVKRNLKLLERLPSAYMYLEKATDLQISLPNTISAQTIATQDNVLIHVTGEEPGSHCGLPQDCVCPVQYNLDVSPEYSITSLIEKGSQRVYSYNNEVMTIHLITNSISTGPKCRTPKSKVMNEVSSLMWNTASSGNETGKLFLHSKYFSGYISGAEFFSLNNKTYIVIGRYYDAVLDSYNLDWILLRINENNTDAEQIQVMPIKGISSLNLFHTAQGVTLIVGATSPTRLRQEEATYFYRFDAVLEEFFLLRTIPNYGCSAAAGVVIQTDSLVVLAHKDAPILIYKYRPEPADNYYFYQSFELDMSPVLAMSVFYTGGFGISDAYLVVVTKNGFYIYSYRYVEGWTLESSGQLEGLKSMVPFELNKRLYLFAPSAGMSSILSVVKYGYV